MSNVEGRYSIYFDKKRMSGTKPPFYIRHSIFGSAELAAGYGLMLYQMFHLSAGAVLIRLRRNT
jgi:hypothetical protein